jgi:hypothetical protein
MDDGGTGMASNAVTVPTNWGIMEKVVVGGDLKALSSEERMHYYRQVCESVGLNPLTRPFDYITLQGKLTLYARKDATEQLRRMHGVSLEIARTETVGDAYVVTVIARTPDGRTDSDMGAVVIKGVSGDALVNAMLKAVTKAKRRVTLSICGLGMLEETETETIHSAQRVMVDEDGVIHEPSAAPTLPFALRPEQWENLHRMAAVRGVMLHTDMTPDEIAGAIRKAGGPPIPGQITPRAVKDALDAIRVAVDAETGEAREDDAYAAAGKSDDDLRAEIAQGSLIGSGR